MRRLRLAGIGQICIGPLAALLVYSNVGFAADSLPACPSMEDFNIAAIRADANGLDCEMAVYQGPISICMRLAWAESEVHLRAVYDSLIATIDNQQAAFDFDPKAQKARFAAAQQAWCTYRDKICDCDVGTIGAGTMSSQIASQCRKEYNEARAKALLTLTNCVGGGHCQQPLLFFMYELHPDQSP